MVMQKKFLRIVAFMLIPCMSSNIMASMTLPCFSEGPGIRAIPCSAPALFSEQTLEVYLTSPFKGMHPAISWQLSERLVRMARGQRVHFAGLGSGMQSAHTYSTVLMELYALRGQVKDLIEDAPAATRDIAGTMKILHLQIQDRREALERIVRNEAPKEDMSCFSPYIQEFLQIISSHWNKSEGFVALHAPSIARALEPSLAACLKAFRVKHDAMLAFFVNPAWGNWEGTWWPVTPDNAADRVLRKFEGDIADILRRAVHQAVSLSTTPFEAGNAIWESGLNYFRSVNASAGLHGGFAALGIHGVLLNLSA